MAKPRRVIPTLFGFVGALALVALGLRLFERAQVFQPSRRYALELEDHPWPGEELWLSARDGTRLHGWFFPADDATERARWLIIHSHGNAGNISHRFEVYDILKQTGASILAYEYRGYGRSSGRPSEAGFYRDIEAAYQWGLDAGFEPERIIAHGNSLGSGPSAYLAAHYPIGGLVLRSAFTSVPDLGKELFPWLPVKMVSAIRFDVHSRLAAMTCPVVILHGAGDRMISIHHARSNYDAASAPKFWHPILPGDHNDPCAAIAREYVAAFEPIFTQRDQ